MPASFLTSLDIRVLDDCGARPKVMTLEPFHYHSEIVGTVVVPRFFSFDGASIPQIAMAITGWPGIRAACIHDYLLSTGVARDTADRAFLEALQVCGVEQELAELMYTGVRAWSIIQQSPKENNDGIGA